MAAGSTSEGVVADNIISAVRDSFFALDEGGKQNALYLALNGRMYFDGATPEQEQFPYCIISEIVEVPNELLGGKTVTATTIQLDTYSNKASSYEINDIQDKLSSLYDDCMLSLDAADHINSTRTNGFITLEADGVWHGIARYRIEWYG